jgi:inosine-uridine nucleoside N-ribohydrolase
MLAPESMEDAVEAFVDIETSGQHSRGMMLIDWYGNHHANRPLIKLVREMTRNAIWDIVDNVFEGN